MIGLRFVHATAVLRRASLAAALAGALCLTLAGPAWAVSKTFGLEGPFESLIENPDHSPAVQAGSHPYAWTTKFTFNHEVIEANKQIFCEYNEETEAEECFEEPFALEHVQAYGNPKDVSVDLPKGMIVNPAATPVRCTEAQLESPTQCPAASSVGIIEPRIDFLLASGPVYNMVPPPGIPAEFGFNVGEVGLVGHIVGRLRTGGDYGLSGDVSNITQKDLIYGASLTLWGDPSDPSHDSQRGTCGSVKSFFKEHEKLKYEREVKNLGAPGERYRFSCPVEMTDTPLLTMPGSCTGKALETTMHVDSWQEPTNVLTPPPAASPAVERCDKLDFSPSLSVLPTPAAVGTESPSGLNVDLKLPQKESLGTLAESTLKEAIVRLPAGMTVSPSAANGLGACPLEGPEGINLASAGAAKCPDSSKIGTMEVETPLLEHPLKGSVFLAQQGNLLGNGSNPFGSLFALYLVAEGQGAVAKLTGEVVLDQETGQLTARFGRDPIRSAATGEDQFLPQVPISDVKMSLFGGPKAPLMTPVACGTYTTTSQLFPWSGGPPSEPSSSFTVNQNCGTGAFTPSFTAGTTNNQAGAYSPFSVTFSRHDGEQRLGGVQVSAPPGLLATLKSVAQCPEPQASKGQCGPESEVGDTSAAVGPGEDPYWVKGGKVYLTGPYEGAPFGLSIVVPAVAGPFNLGDNGKPVVVRARINVDSHTAQAVVTSDPLPTKLQGVPLDIRTVNVTIDRPGFMFNPTNCSPLSVAGTIESSNGASAGVSSPFQAANCAAIPFKPVFTASTQGHTSKQIGASLGVKIASAGIGVANIAKVEVTIPNILPARLTTIQKACPEATFNANPASCPAESNIATAVVHTPLLNSALSGPVYFVSHGGAAFPDTEIILQGEGVTLLLDGHIDIKHGVTYSRFESVPDTPFTSFEFHAPEGPYSIFGANGNLCQTEVRMPTRIVAQNGAVTAQNTLVEPEGCPNKITVLSHTATKHTITLKVAVPGPGRLTASGKGLRASKKSSKGRGILTLTLTAKPHRKHRSRIKLTFTPAKGAPLTASVAVTLRG